MLSALKFVQGAVARKDFVPSLTHYNISNRTIRGFNGAVALCSPIPLDLDVSPKADVFTKAIQACAEGAQLSMAEDKKLSIKSGSFQVFIDCLAEDFPRIEPEGETINIQGEFLKAIETLAPFIAEDASRKWATGVLFRGPSAFATNNVLLIEYWLGHNFPVEINISKQAVQELLRIGEEPSSIQVSEASITFHYPNKRWLRAQNNPTTWPNVGAILEREASPAALDPSFFRALDNVAPFVDDLGKVYFLEDSIATSTSKTIGAKVQLPGIKAGGVFHVKQLQLLEGLATSIDFAMYPAPCLFFGEKVRGAIVGIRA